MICLYAYMQMWYYVSSTYADPGIFANGGEGGEGVQAEKAPLPGKKNSGKLFFFVFSPYLQLLNSFTEGGGPFFFWFDMILFVPSTIFQLYRGRSSSIEPVLSYDKCVLLKDNNAVTPVKLEAAAHMSQVKHSTTEPLCSQRWSDVLF